MKNAGLEFWTERYKYTIKAQELLKKYGVELLENEGSIARAGDEFDNMSWALNYADSIHHDEYARYISNGLAQAVDDALDKGLDAKQAIKDRLAGWKTLFEDGKTFWKQAS